MIKITKNTIDNAVDAEILSADQAQKLYDFLVAQPQAGPAFTLTNVLYYLGGLIAIGAMTLFMTLGWETFGGWGILLVSLVYAAIGIKLTEVFRSRGYAIPAGLCGAFVVALTPLAIYGLQQALGLWPDDSVYRDYHRYIKWHWILMEFGTLAVGALILFRYRYPFLLMPVAVTLWYMSMDLASMLMGDRYDFEFRAQFSMLFGLVMLLIAFWVDFRTSEKGDYAFWLYLFGVMAFWGGLTAQDSDSELAKFGYFCINLLMILIGAVIVRKVFVVFGALGICFYLGYLAWDLFKDSIMFPIILTVIGLLIVVLGIWWQKNEQELTRKVRSFLPASLRDFLNTKSGV